HRSVAAVNEFQHRRCGVDGFLQQEFASTKRTPHPPSSFAAGRQHDQARTFWTGHDVRHCGYSRETRCAGSSLLSASAEANVTASCQPSIQTKVRTCSSNAASTARAIVVGRLLAVPARWPCSTVRGDEFSRATT